MSKLGEISVKATVPVVDFRVLEAFLDHLRGDISGEDRLRAYLGDELSNDTYHRVYVNATHRQTALDADLPAIKEALGLGDGPYTYFLVHVSW